MAGQQRSFNPVLYPNSPMMNYINHLSTVGGQVVHNPTVDNLWESAIGPMVRVPNSVTPGQAYAAQRVINRFQAFTNSSTPDQLIMATGSYGRNALIRATSALANMRAKMGV